jgi:hypothetical protein
VDDQTERKMAEPSKPLPLASTLSEFAGKWVAVDRHTGRAVAAAETPYALSAEIRTRGLEDVAIVRAPDETEPELVGLG